LTSQQLTTRTVFTYHNTAGCNCL